MSDLNPMVEIAEYALRRFVGERADRATAAAVFPFWDRYEFITRATRDEVLSRFPEPAEREMKDGFDFLSGSSPRLSGVAR